jgi:hypothetical protein
MFKGTTPTHYFNVPIDTSRIKELKITYSQKDREIFAKRKEDCIIEEGKITTTLSQEETFMFEPDKFVTIQLRVLMDEGSCLTSKLMMMSVEKCMDNEVLK